MKRFCYKCGKVESEDNPLIGGLCQECLSSRPLLALPELRVVICPRCGMARVGGTWLGTELEEGVRGLMLSRLKVAKFTGNSWEFVPLEQVKGVEVEIGVEREKSSLKVAVSLKGKLDERQVVPLQQQVVTEIPLERHICRVCKLKAGGYYEAILQVRGGDISRIREVVESEAMQASAEDARVFITKVEEVEGGVNFYLSSIALARKLGRILKQRFGAELSESAKLVGQVAGRRRYRVSVLARLKSA